MSASAPGLPMSTTALPATGEQQRPVTARRSRLRRALRGLLLAAVLIFFLTPIVYLTLVSLTPQPEVLGGQIIPSRLAWENWPNAFDSVQVTLFLRNSIIVAALSAGVTMVIAVPATYAMVRFRTGGSFLRSAVLSSYVAPPIVAVIPLFFLLKTTTLIDTLPGLALVHALANLPVAIWLLDSFVREIPVDLEEASWVDGSGRFGTLLRIVLPLLAPGLVAVTIICIILSYNEFLFALVMTYRPETQTLPVGIALFQGDRLVQFGQMAAASLTGMIPIYLVALFFQRGLVRGLTMGAVK
ncbi:MAG: carbohydrate ABC transporter permease [Thermomicrobiales bacterium]|nr:carbohydrate ABC transporter permease [Thermomicrobiales bacterium]